MKSFALVCVTVSLFLTNQSLAQTIIDFESPTYTVGPMATNPGAANPGQDDWYSSLASIQVGGGLIDNVVPAFGGSQSFNTRTLTTTGQVRYAKTGFTDIAGQDGSSIDWYARRTEIGVVDDQALHLYYFGETHGTGEAAVNVGFVGDKIRRRSGASNLDSTETTVVDEWYRFTATLNFTATTYDLAVKSTSLSFGDPGFLDLSYANLGFRDITQEDVTTVMILSQGINNDYFTDNITFIPAPGNLGDFDNDNDIDGADFLAWQRGESPNGATAGDLAEWETAYGTAALTATIGAVPEPTSVVLLGLGMTVATMACRRRAIR